MRGRWAALLLSFFWVLGTSGCTPLWGKSAQGGLGLYATDKALLKPPRPPEYFRMGKLRLDPPLILDPAVPARKVYVEVFDNRSSYPAAHQVFRNALVYVLKDRGLEIVDSKEGADLVMSGTIQTCAFQYTKTMFASGFWSEFANGKTGRIHHASLIAELLLSWGNMSRGTTATAIFRTKESDIASASNELALRLCQKVARAIR